MAIQISGTQVIGNSRELTNIASVGATTATAIGNAGVGGLTTLVNDNTSITGSSGALTFTLGDYRQQTFVITNLAYTAENQGGRTMIRLTNSSNTTLSASQYLFSNRSDSSVYNETADSRWWIWSKEHVGSSANNNFFTVKVTFDNAYSSTLPTQANWNTSVFKHEYASASGAGQGTGSHRLTQRNQKFIILGENGGGTWASGATFSSWGIN